MKMVLETDSTLPDSLVFYIPLFPSPHDLQPRQLNSVVSGSLLLQCGRTKTVRYRCLHNHLDK